MKKTLPDFNFEILNSNLKLKQNRFICEHSNPNVLSLKLKPYIQFDFIFFVFKK